jgi:hypothetical protein
MEVSDASETFVTTYKTTWRHNSEEYDLIFNGVSTSDLIQFSNTGCRYPTSKDASFLMESESMKCHLGGFHLQMVTRSRHPGARERILGSLL